MTCSWLLFFSHKSSLSRKLFSYSTIHFHFVLLFFIPLFSCTFFSAIYIPTLNPFYRCADLIRNSIREFVVIFSVNIINKVILYFNNHPMNFLAFFLRYMIFCVINLDESFHFYCYLWRWSNPTIAHKISKHNYMV